jgi:hypothetical protein
VHKKSASHEPLSHELPGDIPETSTGLGLIWGVTNIAELIGRTPRQTYHLLSCGALPAAKIGNRWVTSTEALTRCFAVVSKGCSNGGAT